MEVLFPLDLAVKIMGLEDRDIPESLELQNLIQEVVTDQVRRYGLHQVKKYRARLLEDWRQLQALL